MCKFSTILLGLLYLTIIQQLVTKKAIQENCYCYVWPQIFVFWHRDVSFMQKLASFLTFWPVFMLPPCKLVACWNGTVLSRKLEYQQRHQGLLYSLGFHNFVSQVELVLTNTPKLVSHWTRGRAVLRYFCNNDGSGRAQKNVAKNFNKKIGLQVTGCDWTDNLKWIFFQSCCSWKLHFV